jgi:FkbM family methyltransferase
MTITSKLWKFLSLPLSAQLLVLRRKLGLQRFPLIIRLPDAGYWLARPEFGRGLNDRIWHYEIGERRFLCRYLRPGMTVLDIGAHVGLYTLLAARKVTPNGCVIAFEPSPRERRFLHLHLRLNRCHHVKVEPFALADQEGEMTLFVYRGAFSNCGNTMLNSLRQQSWALPCEAISVPVTTLDAYLTRHGIRKVDFVKMDTEGAELSILAGAKRLLTTPPRPLFMVELNDSVTQPWGYPSSAILDTLLAMDFHAFTATEDGFLVPAPLLERYELLNLIAVPNERLDEVNPFVAK